MVGHQPSKLNIRRVRFPCAAPAVQVHLDAANVDRKKLNMGFLSCYLVTLILVAGAYFTQAPVIFSLFLAFVFVPIIDQIVGQQKDFTHPESPIYRLSLLAWLPCQLLLLIVGSFYVANLSVLGALAWAVPMGILAGAFGITIGHELGHKHDLVSKLHARVLFSSVCFPGFPIEHNLGHHVNVATKEDPATARYGESLWAFILRGTPQQFIDAWKIEARRLRKRGFKPYGIHNEMYRLTGLTLALALGSLMIGGLPALAFFVGQGVFATFLLQAINYVEHYGLEREKIGKKYEKVGPTHSWDANWVVTNHLLFGLQQHADHHQHGTKKFEDLRPEPTAPNMIQGYPTMVVLSLIPPVWRSVMHPKLEQLRNEHEFTREDHRGLEASH